jgi:phage gpG-like protein
MAGLQVSIPVDQFTPFATRLRAGLTANLQQILQTVGFEVVQITQQAFTDASLRAAPWAPKRDGSPATLRQSGALFISIRITDIGATTVTVGSDRIYAAAQQLGATIVPKNKRTLAFKVGGVSVFARKVTIPPRPFFPIDASGNLTSVAQQRIAAVLNQAIAAYANP